MKGFVVDKKGNPLHVAKTEWEPEVTLLDENGKEVTVKIPQPENTVYPDNFDEILAAMAAPPEKRMKPVFDKKGTFKLVSDNSSEVKLQIARNKKPLAEDAELSKA